MWAMPRTLRIDGSLRSCLVSCILVSLATTQVFAIRPVIIIHGIFDGASQMGDLKNNIQTAFPGTPVHVIDLFDSVQSLDPLWKQVETVRNVTNGIMRSAQNGVNLIGFSQGGLVARGIIHTSDNHNIHTFISLSSPLNGQYGDTSYLKWLFPSLMKEELYKVFYSSYGQRWSIGNYWKDPHEVPDYRRYSDYLAQLNNETVSGKCRFQSSWKTNFMRLRRLVLVGGKDDGVITPWQSAQFGCFDADENVVPMRQLKIYQEDTFGLRTLDESNATFECTVHGVKHVEWHGNPTVFRKCVEPFLS